MSGSKDKAMAGKTFTVVLGVYSPLVRDNIKKLKKKKREREINNVKKEK